MRRTLSLLSVLFVAVILTGCAFPLLERDPAFNKGSGLNVKPVSAKRDPAYLIAVDGSECTVSKKRFDKVKVGDNQLCLWSAPR